MWAVSPWEGIFFPELAASGATNGLHVYVIVSNFTKYISNGRTFAAYVVRFLLRRVIFQRRPLTPKQVDALTPLSHLFSLPLAGVGISS